MKSSTIPTFLLLLQRKIFANEKYRMLFFPRGKTFLY